MPEVYSRLAEEIQPPGLGRQVLKVPSCCIRAGHERIEPPESIIGGECTKQETAYSIPGLLIPR